MLLYLMQLHQYKLKLEILNWQDMQKIQGIW